MTTPVADDPLVRYATSALVLVVTIIAGTSLALTVPQSLPYRGLVTWLVIAPVAVLGVDLFWRIEEGVSPYRLLRSRLR